jgi:MarR family transcriptional regulator, transcriptional regulator for hemolysin
MAPYYRVPYGCMELDSPPWLRVDATLMATARAIREAYDDALAEIDLSLSQASLLAFVVESGALAQTRLAERLQLGKAATGALVDALEAKGLVVRRPAADDRRVWLVEPTAAGKERAAEVDEIDRRLRTRLRRGVTKAERQQLASLLLRLQVNLAD